MHLELGLEVEELVLGIGGWSSLSWVAKIYRMAINDLRNFHVDVIEALADEGITAG